MNQHKKTIFHDLGLVDYHQAWSLQEKLFQDIVDQKVRNRTLQQPEPTTNHLVFCQHPHVYTLGKSGKREHLLASEQGLKDIHAQFVPINRGGDITYHGPGQLVGYPILDLDNFVTDIHLYLRTLEEAIILTCHDYGISAGRIDGLTGVWIEDRKICAMGVRSSRWVTMHGFAFNVNTDLGYFGHIVPCGISDKAVTSLQQELGKEVDFSEASERVLHHLEELFGLELTT